MLYRNFRGKGGLILLEIAWVLRVQHAPVCEIPLSLETPVNWEELHSRRSLHAGEPLLICNVWNESTAALIWEILCNKKYMPCSSVSGFWSLHLPLQGGLIASAIPSGMWSCTSVHWDINNGVISVLVRLRGGAAIDWGGTDGALSVYYGPSGLDMHICGRWVDSLPVQ